MRLGITGAAGFIGTHLTQRLEAESHELVLISRRSKKDNSRIVANNLSDVKVLTKLLTGCKVVAHCAGINREIGSQTYQRVHVDAVRNIVEAAKNAGFEKRFI